MKGIIRKQREHYYARHEYDEVLEIIIYRT